MRHRTVSLVVALAAVLAVVVGEAPAQEARQLRIVKQPGLGYLQLVVMRELKLIEKRAPGVDVEWRQLTSGPVIRDAMIAGQMDIGSGGVGPFVQAVDRGIDWKTLGTLNEMPLYLNCARPDIKKLADLKPTDRIAMPAIGSMQHVVLQMQVAQELVYATPAEAAKIYVSSEKSKSSEAEILAIMKQDGIKYTMTPSGFVKVATFMGKIGMIKKLPASWKDYAFERLHALPGS